MRIGIVGSEGAKFTPETEQAARQLIRQHIEGEDLVVSGECHLGGVDIFAKEEALKMGIPYKGFPPFTKSWSDGYKPRNQKIAENSDLVICITVKELPPDYAGMRFKFCYHCGTDEHIKSGGCWTVKYAKKLGKEGYVLVI